MKVSLGDEPAAVSGVAIGACETRQRQPDREHRRHPFVPPLSLTSIFQNAGSRLQKPTSRWYINSKPGARRWRETSQAGQSSRHPELALRH